MEENRCTLLESYFPGLSAFPRCKPSLALASSVQGDGGGKHVIKPYKILQLPDKIVQISGKI